MKFRQIARWEFVEKVRSKAFLISLVLLPLIMVVFGVLPGFLASKEDEKPLTVGIIDETGKLFDELNKRVDEKFKLKGGVSNYILKDLKKDGEGIDEERRQATQLLASDKLEGYFEIPASVFDSGKVVYRAQNVGNVRIQERFSRTIEEVIVEGRLRGQGLDPDKIKKLLASVDVKSVKVNGKGEEKESGFLETFFSAYIVIMMLFFLVMTSGQLLIRSVLEEKSNRVMEVLLSSCSARDLMVGKILGLSGLGILQMLIWGTISMGIALKTGSNFFSPDYLLLSVVYFVLGYLLYAAIFVTAGSPVTTEQEAQQITSYISLMLVFPIVLAV
ncbi:MAG TPA: ABC transporter permease, partial [Bacteroidota bacterium]|nr:ABC transporter permease [Bacteroidota bacterium]